MTPFERPNIMTHPPQETVTRLLSELQDGDQAVLDELFPLVYDELRARAQKQRRRWHGDYTLNTTALVHEAYLKLVDQDRLDPKSRAHFFALAAQAMRQILINYAEQCKAQKRGGDIQKLSLDEMKVALQGHVILTEERASALLDLNDALKRLELIGERQSKIIECRFFGAMSIEETAAALGISPATVSRDWTVAKAWLYRELQHDMEG